MSGLPIDFSKRAQQLLDVVPDKDFARTRTLFFLYRVPPKEAGDIGKSEEDFPIHYPQIEMVGRGQLSADDKTLTDVRVLLNTHGIEGRMIQAPDGSLFIDSGPLAGRGIISRNWTQSQLPGSLMGKVLHINADGSIPPDNPFIEKADTRPEIWAFGCATRKAWRSILRGASGVLRMDQWVGTSSISLRKGRTTVSRSFPMAVILGELINGD